MKYLTQSCQLGYFIIASHDENKVDFLAFGDSAEDLVAQLQAAFLKAKTIKENQGNLSDWALKISLYLEKRQQVLEIPFSFNGTAFQNKVWSELCRIPSGSTLTYGELAKQLGLPTTYARAIGNACGQNNISVLIPCHRVVAANQLGGGYRWGVKRKEYLLALETIRPACM